MIDYINIALNIENKISDYSINNLINVYGTSILITSLICIILISIIIMIIKNNPEIGIFISCLSFIGYILLSVYTPKQKQITQFDLAKYSTQNLQKYSISETIDINNAVDANDIIYAINHNHTSSDNSSNQFEIHALLEYGNINSLNNFYSNIIYLDNYYKNNYTEESEYEWINKILNEFYKPDNTNQATTNVDILQELKN